MKKIIIGIWDKKSQEFIAINMDSTIETAIRNFRMACEDEKSLLSKYPEDFEMYMLDKMDFTEACKPEKNGKFKYIEKIAEAIDYKKEEK